MIKYPKVCSLHIYLNQKLCLYKIPSFCLFFLLFYAYIPSLNAQVCESQSAPSPHVGAALNPQYTNLWKQASGQDIWSNDYGNGNNLSIGADGWPIQNSKSGGVQTHGFRFSRNQVLPYLNANDIIKVRFKGPASAIGSGRQETTWQNIQTNTPSAGFTTAELKLSSNFGNSANSFYFEFLGRVTDIQIMRPGYDFDDPRLVVDEYVQHAKHWKAFRFMGLSGVNGSFSQTWGKRTSKNAPTNLNTFKTLYLDLDPIDKPWKIDKSNGMNESVIGRGSGGGGMSWEDQIDICNYLNIDMWINVPTLADDDYMKNLAALIRQRLKSNLNVNVEIGNELWNTFGPSFISGYMMHQLLTWELNYGTADQKKIFGGNFCPGCGLTSEYEQKGFQLNRGKQDYYDAWTRWMARRLKEHAESFATVFGWRDEGGQVGTRIRMVLAGQPAFNNRGGWNIGPGIEFLHKAYGPNAPRKYLYAIASALYFAPHVFGANVNSSVDEIVNAERKHIDSYFEEFGANWNDNNVKFGNGIEGFLGFAKSYGLKFYAYEGGSEISTAGVGGVWQDFNNTSQYFADPRSGQNTSLFLTKWFAWCGYDALFMKNGDFQEPGGCGYCISSTLNENNPIRSAWVKIATSVAPPLTTERGGVLGATPTTLLDARKYASYWSDWQTGSYGFSGKDYDVEVDANWKVTGNMNWEPMMIRCQKNGTYTLTLEKGGESLGALHPENTTYCDIYLNDSIIKKNQRFTNLAFSRTIPYSGSYPRRFYWSNTIDINIPYGVHTLRVVPVTPTAAQPGNKNSGKTNWIQLIGFKFDLKTALPPFQPKPVLGEVTVCKGNNKAYYEIDEVDISACEYEWSGLPAGAKILDKVMVPLSNPAKYSSGQGTFKIFVDWGNVVPGDYTFKVAAKNLDVLGNWQSSVPRDIKVKIQTCGFEIAPNPVCIGQPSQFTPVPMSNITQYVWDNGKFGKPNSERFTTSTSGTPLSVTYATEGEFKVSLKTVDATGKDAWYFNTVNAVSCNSPTVVSPVNYCKGAAAVAVTAVPTNGGTNLKWYTTATSNVTPATLVPSTAAVDTISYWVSQQNTTGESDRARIDIIISAAPAAPTLTGVNPLEYCKGAMSTVNELTGKVTPAVGTTLKWYLADATTSLATPTNTVTTTAAQFVWNITQSIGSCESPKASLTVKVNDGPQFTVQPENPLSCNSKGKLILSGLTAGQIYKVSYNTVTPADSVANAQGQIILNLPQGNYSNVKLASGTCTANAPSPGTYTLTDPLSPTFTVAARQPAACGALGAIVLKGLKNNTAYKISYNSIVDEARSTTGDSISIALPKNDYYGFKVNLNGCMKTDAGTYKLSDPVVIPLVEKTGNSNYCQNQVVNITDLTTRVKGEPNGQLKWYTAIDGVPTNQPQAPSTAVAGSKSVWVSQTIDNCESDKLELKIQVASSTALTVTPKDPTACGATDGALEISGLANIKDYNIEYKKEGQSQPFIKFTSNSTGKITLSSLAAGSYSSITATPILGNSCFTNSSETQTLTAPGAPTTPPSIAGAADYCAGSTIAALTATANSGGTIEWFSNPELTTSVGTTATYQPTQITGSATYYAIETVNGN